METEIPQNSGGNLVEFPTKLGIGASIVQALKWQKDVNSNVQNMSPQLKEVCGCLQEFRTYLIMKPGSAF